MDALARGWSNFRRSYRLWPGMFALKLGLALLFTIPVWMVVGYSLEHSVAGSLLSERWSLDVLTELIASNSGAAVAFLVILVAYGTAAFLIKQFVNGGIYGAYLRRDLNRAGGFFAASGAGFTGHLMISLVMIPVYLILLFMGQALSTVLPSHLFGQFGTEYMAGRALQVAVVVAFILMGVMVSESLRFRKTACPNECFRELVSGSLDFLRVRGVRLYGYYIVLFVPFVMLWVLVENLALVVVAGVPGLIGILFEMILFQLCSFVRTGQSLLFSAIVGPVFRSANPELFDPVQAELPLD